VAAPVLALVISVGSADATLATTPVPYMGWNPYYAKLDGSDEATFESVAQSLISSGLQQAGYKIFWLDAGWASGRDLSGNLTVSQALWPDSANGAGLSGFTTWLHQHGFLAGIYTDAGTSGCGNSTLGSYGHKAAGSTNPYSLDVNQFAAWGFDAVKADFCGAGQNWQFQSPNDPRTLYREFASAVANNSSGRPMILNVCDFWAPGSEGGGLPSVADSSWDAYSWAPSLAQSWRTDTDIGSPGNVMFTNVLRNLDQDSASQTALQTTPTIQNAAGPPGSSGIAWGHWNDPDYLAPQLGMTLTQAQSQFSMWAMVAAPLILGSDPGALSPDTVSMLENPQVIAIDQDSLGVQGSLVSQSGSGQVWVKPLANGDRAVALFNRGSGPLQISTTASAVGLPPAASYRLVDQWTNGTTTTSGAISASVPSDAVVLYRVTPLPGLSVGISSPANGAVVGTTPITVAGTAIDLAGVNSVTVNGVAATLSGSNWTASVSLKTGQNPITATAKGNDGTIAQTSESVTYALAPKASISSPASGKTYTVGQAVRTTFICSEGTAGPGIASCVDSGGASHAHGRLNTSSPGRQTYTVTATSKDGQMGTARIRYTVAPVASVPGRVGTLGAALKFTFACKGVAGQRCRGQANPTAVEKLSANGKQITGVLSSRPRSGRYRIVTILTGTLSAAAGQGQGVSIGLNSTGQMLRKQFKILPSEVQISATTNGHATTIRTARVTFGPDPPRASIADTPKTNRVRATLDLGCLGLKTQVCRGTVTLTTFEKLSPDGKTITKLFSAPSGKRQPVTIAAGAWIVRTGKTLAIVIRLNATGKTLLTQLGKIPSTLTITPTYGGYTLGPITRTITFQR
jgi:Alpha galactosidase A/Alpha galactosidase C-terminal beta sandwich domain/Glucodextranase, domain B